MGNTITDLNNKLGKLLGVLEEDSEENSDLDLIESIQAIKDKDWVYEISTVEEFTTFANMVNGYTETKNGVEIKYPPRPYLNAKLMNDIEFFSYDNDNVKIPYDFISIGTKDNPYMGTFDGNNYSISGEISFSVIKNDEQIDLYGSIFNYTGQNCLIKNLNCDFTSSYLIPAENENYLHNSSQLVLYALGDLFIENCKINTTISLPMEHYSSFIYQSLGNVSFNQCKVVSNTTNIVEYNAFVYTMNTNKKISILQSSFIDKSEKCWVSLIGMLNGNDDTSIIIQNSYIISPYFQGFIYQSINTKINLTFNNLYISATEIYSLISSNENENINIDNSNNFYYSEETTFTSENRLSYKDIEQFKPVENDDYMKTADFIYELNPDDFILNFDYDIDKLEYVYNYPILRWEYPTYEEDYEILKQKVKIINDNILEIPNLYYYQTDLTSSSFPLREIQFNNCKKIKGLAFYNSNIIKAIFPNVLQIEDTNCFYDCTELETVNLQNLKTLPEQTFEGCTLLSSIDLSNCEQIQEYAFKGCTSLTSIDLSGLNVDKFKLLTDDNSPDIQVDENNSTILNSPFPVKDFSTNPSLTLYVQEEVYEALDDITEEGISKTSSGTIGKWKILRELNQIKFSKKEATQLNE